MKNNKVLKIVFIIIGVIVSLLVAIGVVMISFRLVLNSVSRTSYVSHYLENKYHKHFVVNVVSLSFTNNEYRCYQKDNENIVFKTELINGKDIVDSYEEALLGFKIEKIISNSVSKIASNAFIRPYVKKGAEGIGYDESIYHFLERSDSVRFNLLVIFDETLSDQQTVFNQVKNEIKKFDNVYGSLYVFATNINTMNEIKIKATESTIVTNSLYDMFSEGSIKAQFENGQFELIN